MRRFFAFILALISLSLVGLALADAQVNLSNAQGEVTLTEPGTYTLYGDFSGNLCVSPGQGDVTLALTGLHITSSSSPAIACTSGDSLTVFLADNTENTLSSDGTTVFESSVPVILTGNGALTIYTRNQAFGSDTRYTVQDGDLLVLGVTMGDMQAPMEDALPEGAMMIVGSETNDPAPQEDPNRAVGTPPDAPMGDMNGMPGGFPTITAPQEDSAQASLILVLENPVSAGSHVMLVSLDGDIVRDFTAEQSFQSLLISSPLLQDGTYCLLVNGSPISIAGSSQFDLSGSVTTIGTFPEVQMQPMGGGKQGAPAGGGGRQGGQPPQGQGDPGNMGDGTPPEMNENQEQTQESSEVSSDSQGNPQGTPPEIPSGDMGTLPDMSSGEMGTPPDMPSGEMGTPPNMPSGSMGTPPDGQPSAPGGPGT